MMIMIMILTLLHHTTHINLHTTTGNNCEATQKQRVVSNKMARDKAEQYGMWLCVYVYIYIYIYIYRCCRGSDDYQKFL